MGMNMPKMAIALGTVAMLFSGCAMSSMSTGSAQAKTTATGSAGGSNAQNANSGLERCSQTLGTLALFEDKSETWYHHLTSDLRLPSTIPVLRLLAQQSNCFVIVERGDAMKQMMTERQLMESGEMRSGSNFGKGQIVAADYTMIPSITFSAKDTGGAGAVIGGLFGSVAGAVAGGFKTSDASTVLTLIENRSGVQLAAAEGSARNTDFSLVGGMFGSGLGGGAGAYSNTPEGKVLIAAFTDSMNNIIKAVKSYKAQQVAGGLGTGGQLGVQGGQAAMNGGVLEGVMTERTYNQNSGLWEYAIVTKDRQNTYRFTAPQKILYKDDLVSFELSNGNVNPNSLKVVERRYYQKYWQ